MEISILDNCLTIVCLAPSRAPTSTSSYLQQYLVSCSNIWSPLPTKCQLRANLPPQNSLGSEEYRLHTGQSGMCNATGYFDLLSWVFPHPPFLFLCVAVEEMTQGCICLSLYLAQESVRGELAQEGRRRDYSQYGQRSPLTKVTGYL